MPNPVVRKETEGAGAYARRGRLQRARDRRQHPPHARKEIVRYTKQADQKRLATAAILRLEKNANRT
jgi:hypothetical protein